MRNWLLPEKFEDILPPQAQRIDRMRAKVLELFRVHGYELVIPPCSSTRIAADGHRGTIWICALSAGRPALREDDGRARRHRTPGRADRCASSEQERRHAAVLRGSVLLTLGRGVSTRPAEPLQIGAEIYGHPGIESDLEIQQLLIESLAACGISGARLDVGHVAVFRAICRHGGVGAELESELYEALEGKDLPALRAVTQSMPEATRNALLALPELYGDGAVLERARRALPKYAEIDAALEDLKVLSRARASPCRWIWRTFADITTTAGWCSRPMRRAWPTRSPSATIRRGRKGIRARAHRQPDSAWTCAISRALRRTRRKRPRFEPVLERRWARRRDPRAANRRGGRRGRASGTRRGGVQPDCDRELVKRDGKWAVRKLGKAEAVAKNVVVIGTQWGDEGKGKVVDWLTDHAQGVVRFRAGTTPGIPW